MPSGTHVWLGVGIALAVLVGIRPEDLREAGGNDPQDLVFEALVEVVEPLGSEILLDTRVGNQTIVARVDPTVRTKHHQKIRLAFIPEGSTSSTTRPTRPSPRITVHGRARTQPG